MRTKETFHGIAQAFGGVDGLKWTEEPRLREQDYGNFDKDNIKELHKMKKVFGQFYYRFPEGESPCDVYDRGSSVLETLYRLWQAPKEENYIIVSHGLMILVFMMRFLMMTTNEFKALAPLDNCEMVLLEKNVKNNWYDRIYSIRKGERTPGLRKLDPHPGEDDEVWDGVQPKSIRSRSKKH